MPAYQRERDIVVSRVHGVALFFATVRDRWRISIDLEVDFDIELDEDWVSVLCGGREFVLLDSRNSSLVETQSQRANDGHFRYGAVWLELEMYESLPAIEKSARHFIELWILGSKEFWWLDCATDAGWFWSRGLLVGCDWCRWRRSGGMG